MISERVASAIVEISIDSIKKNHDVIISLYSDEYKVYASAEIVATVDANIVGWFLNVKGVLLMRFYNSNVGDVVLVKYEVQNEADPVSSWLKLLLKFDVCSQKSKGVKSFSHPVYTQMECKNRGTWTGFTPYLGVNGGVCE